MISKQDFMNYNDETRAEFLFISLQIIENEFKKINETLGAIQDDLKGCDADITNLYDKHQVIKDKLHTEIKRLDFDDIDQWKAIDRAYDHCLQNAKHINTCLTALVNLTKE